MQTQPSILIVGDDVVLRDLLFQILKIGGYEVVTAGNRKEALELLKTTPHPSLMIVDLMKKEDQRQFIQGLGSYLEKLGKKIVSEANPGNGTWFLTTDPVKLTLSNGRTSTGPLTAKEFQIVTLLNSAPNKNLSRKDLLASVWGAIKVHSKTVNVHVFNLRRKISVVGANVDFIAPDTFQLTGPDATFFEPKEKNSEL